ncbi:hypothetical protein PtrSN002B_009931 [Pyrenophora tritici-repentis]|uniref:DUF1421 multi-domain protein n=1 Tax=Pyrenophora tritici-repentis TaxID=45151 RepID=A0A2W1GH78_9PLEO|nr:hypothetical protein PtrV1_10515 [Pyrenophora tritici-repentis]KAF7567615.1 DUF1421 multi-domain protein [Pyrenophora tritici-repentis]KAI0575094.1 hypothetical protein Alg130_09411 [Pyrenophora tritici-repentis]KAI0610575.1 hypothetical protein TUN205_05163 [Pyrenophora tritici-repentis]KAI1529502.1 hypothetical protein PtrSN001C_009015 [Pyrenophora tritici-repentis]
MPSPSLFPTLPNELLDQIFAHVSKRDLMSLAETHTVFILSAQSNLVSDFELPAQSTLADPFAGYYQEENYIPGSRRPLHDDRQTSSSSLAANWAAVTSLNGNKQDWNGVPPTIQQHRGADHIRERQKTVALFLYTLIAAPRLAKQIKHMRIDAEWGFSLFVHTQLQEIFAGLPKLERLSVVCVGELQRLVNSAQNLTAIELTIPCHTALSSLLQTPRITTFTVGTSRSWNISTDTITTPEITQLPYLHTFDSGTLFLSQHAAVTLIARVPHQQHLSLRIESLNHYPTSAPNFSSLLSTTLTSLTISSTIDEQAYKPSYYSFTPIPIDLSHLSALTTLSLASPLIYNHTTTPGMPDCSSFQVEDFPKGFQHNLSRLDQCNPHPTSSLPPSLRALKFTFPWPLGLFARGLGLHEQFPLSPKRTQEKGCAFMVDFAKAKTAEMAAVEGGAVLGVGGMRLGYLPLLEKVAFREVLAGIDMPLRDLDVAMEYTVPECLRGVFEEVGVELSVELVSMRHLTVFKFYSTG